MNIKRYRIEMHVPHEQMRFTTAGDWKLDDDGTLNVWVCESPHPYELIVLAHELSEIWVCLRDGVESNDCDAFDALWERELAEGLHRREEEAGCDRRAPYFKGHRFGMRIEKLMCRVMRVHWETYCSFWDEFFHDKEPEKL